MLESIINGTCRLITTSDSVDVVGDRNNKIRKLILNKNLRYLGSFSGTNIENIEFNQKLETIGYRAFEKKEKLKELDFKENLKEIDLYAFSECTNLEEITFRSLPKIDISTFKNCTNIKTIKFIIDNKEEIFTINEDEYFDYIKSDDEKLTIKYHNKYEDIIYINISNKILTKMYHTKDEVVIFPTTSKNLNISKTVNIYGNQYIKNGELKLDSKYDDYDFIKVHIGGYDCEYLDFSEYKYKNIVIELEKSNINEVILPSSDDENIFELNLIRSSINSLRFLTNKTNVLDNIGTELNILDIVKDTIEKINIQNPHPIADFTLNYIKKISELYHIKFYNGLSILVNNKKNIVIPEEINIIHNIIQHECDDLEKFVCAGIPYIYKNVLKYDKLKETILNNKYNKIKLNKDGYKLEYFDILDDKINVSYSNDSEVIIERYNKASYKTSSVNDLLLKKLDDKYILGNRIIIPYNYNSVYCKNELDVPDNVDTIEIKSFYYLKDCVLKFSKNNINTLILPSYDELLEQFNVNLSGNINIKQILINDKEVLNLKNNFIITKVSKGDYNYCFEISYLMHPGRVKYYKTCDIFLDSNYKVLNNNHMIIDKNSFENTQILKKKYGR